MNELPDFCKKNTYKYVCDVHACSGIYICISTEKRKSKTMNNPVARTLWKKCPVCGF